MLGKQYKQYEFRGSHHKADTICAPTCGTPAGFRKEWFRWKNRSKKAPETIKMESQMDPKRAKEPLKTPLKNRVENISKKDAKRRKGGIPLWSEVHKQIDKLNPKNTFKEITGKHEQ